MRRHRRDLRILSEINLTNMVDTAFILLIGFMLLAPAIKHGLQLELPQVSQASELSTDAKTVTIVIKKRELAGTSEPIYIEDERVELDEIEGIIARKQALYPKLDVIIEGDAESTLDTFAKVLSILKGMGIESIGVPTDPIPKPTPGRRGN
jgi:biopolymer transport protein ExbD